MVLFNMFKTTDFESLDEETQIDIANKLGIIGVKNDVKAILKRLDDLEQHSEELDSISHWQDNIITADEAFKQVKENIEAYIPKELNKAFKEIQQAIDDERTWVKLNEYEYEPVAWGPAYKRKYHLNNLIRLLPDYSYSVEVHEEEDNSYHNYVLVSWDKAEDTSTPQIDPGKKYILPMDGYTGGCNDGSNYTYYAFKSEYSGWRSIAHLGNKSAIEDHYAVSGKYIIDGPDWVKAIKPIEVEE